MISPSDFVTRWSGHQCCDGGLCECVALANQWCDENGWPRPQGSTAASLAFGSGWRNVGFAAAEAGDLVVFRSTLGGSGGDGHIDLYLTPAGAGTFVGFDQHWDDVLPNTYCHRVTHGPADTGQIQAVWRYDEKMALDPNDPIVQEIRSRLEGIANMLVFAPDVTISGQKMHPRMALIADVYNLLAEVKQELDGLIAQASGPGGGGVDLSQLADLLDAASAKARGGG